MQIITCFKQSVGLSGQGYFGNQKKATFLEIYHLAT